MTRLGFKGNALSRLAKSIGMQAGVQGGTEAAQKIPEEWGAGKDPFREGIGKDYINEAAAGAIMGGGPGVAGAIRRNSPANEIASEIDRAVQGATFGDADAQVRASMSPYQDTGTISFTRPDSPTAQAGLVPIVVPTMEGDNQGGENGGLLGDTPGMVSGRGESEGRNGIGGLASGGLVDNGIRGSGSGSAGIDVPNNGAPELLGNGSEAPAINVGLPRVAARASDSELLGRVTATLPQAEQKDEPATVMNGRGGKGYATEQDAQVAQQVGMKRDPEMDWRIEPADGGRFRVAAYAKEKADSDWSEFAPESGTLNVPRADMPQIKAEHRGALTNFMNARGISHQQEEVDAGTLKPTQREFSQAKVQQARDYVGGDRPILVSSDNHVLDGHHQWLAKKDSGQPVKVIRLNAPIKDLMLTAKEFPSVQSSEGATTVTEDANAARDIAGAGATLDQAQGPADAMARPDIQPGSGEGDIAAQRDESIRATGTVADGSIASDVNNARTAAAAPVQVIERARAAVASDKGAKIRQSIKPLTESQALASAIAARAGRTFTVIESTNGKPVPNGMVIDDKHVIVAADADDAPLFVTMHEVYHGIPEAKRAPLNKALLDLFNEDKRSDFAKEFGYDAADRQLLDEEIPAFMAQAISRRKDFWVELRRKMGDADFAAIAKQIITGLDAMIQSAKAAYGAGFEKKYIKDVEAARKLLTTAYADAMAGKPIEDATGTDWQKNVQRKDELLAANMPTAKPAKSMGEAMRERVQKADPFLALIAKHGVSIKDRSDVGGEKNKPKMVPGFGPLFRKAGLRLDELALMANEAGFLTDYQMNDDADTGGTGQLAAMIRRALTGEVVGGAEQEGPAQDEMLYAEAQALGIDTAGIAADDVYDLVVAAHAARREAELDAEYEEARALLADLNDDEAAAMQADSLAQLIEDLQNAEQENAGDGQSVDEVAAQNARGITQEGRDDSFQLEGETAAEARLRIQQQEKAAREGQADDARATKAERDALNKREVAARQGASADNFQLGQDANDSLSGQKPMFSKRADEIPPAFYRKIKVPLEVYIAEEDAYETVDVPANQALASVREDIDNYKALIKCMKG